MWNRFISQLNYRVDIVFGSDLTPLAQDSGRAEGDDNKVKLKMQVC